MTNSFFLITLIFCSFSIGAQNFVPDSSFEKNRSVPMVFSAIGSSYNWEMPTQGTSDLYCACSRKNKLMQDKAYSEVDVPQNLMAYQPAHSGTCYAGFFATSHGSYREYIQTQLLQPLEKNKTYLFSCYLNLADYSQVSVDQLGVCFLNKKAAYKSTNVINDLKPLYINIEQEVGTDIEDWHKVSISYKAKGGERYLLFGCFKVNTKTKTNRKAPDHVKTRINQTKGRDAYYFIDDVSLVEVVYDSTPLAVEDTVKLLPPVITKDTMLVFENILFATNKTTLLPSSNTELDQLAEYLIKNDSLSVEVAGHTDNAGSRKTNEKLSVGRAKAVADYLVSKGIDKSRITYIGYGSSQPVSNNDNEEGRRKNRRVEFFIRKG